MEWRDGRSWLFDYSGRLTELRSSWGAAALVAYNAADRPILVTTPGFEIEFVYDSFGYLSTMELSDGRTVAFTRDGDGGLTGVVRPDGRVQSFVLDAEGRVAEVRDAADSLIVSNVYGADGRIASQTTPLGDTVTFVYDDANYRTMVTDQASGDVTVYTHDGSGRLIAVTDALGSSVARDYDALGNVTFFEDRRAGQHSRVYDAVGNPLSAEGPDGATTSYTYDSSNRLLTSTDPEGAVTTYTYVGDSRVPAAIEDPEGGVTTIATVDGLVTAVEDADGVASTFAYDTGRNLISVTDGDGNTTTYTYDAAGNRLSETTALGHQRSWTYDAAGRVLTETDPAGATTTFTYDPAGRPDTVTDPAGGVTDYDYDTAGNLVRVTDAVGNVVDYGYDASGDLVSITEPGSAVTTNTWGALARLTQQQDPTGGATSYGYDPDGNVVETIDALNGTTTATYDALGRVLSHTDAAGAVTAYSYDGRGLVTSVLDAEGGETTTSYDDAGRVVAVEDPRGGVTSYTYTPAGRVATVTDPTGRTTSYTYDPAGRVATVTDTAGNVTTTAYDDDGRVVSVTSDEGLVTSFTYDPAGRPVTSTAPDGGVTTTTYTPRGQVATVTDPAGGVVGYSYDLAGRLTSATDPNGGVTSYAYDGRGNRTGRTDSRGGVEAWEWDASNRLVAYVDQLGRRTEYSWDAKGRLDTVTHPSGRTADYDYDGADRITQITYGDNTSVTFAYDGLGRRTSMVDARGTTNWTYDAAGNLIHIAYPDGKALSATYDLAGRRRSLTYPDATTATYTYDDAGRLATVAHPDLGTVTYTWDGDGRPLTETSADGTLTRTWTYTNGRATTYTETIDGTTRTVNLTYDPAGRLVGTDDGVDPVAYSYDPAGQLLAADATSGDDLAWTYDSTGNRLTATVAGQTTTYSYDAAHQITTATREPVGQPGGGGGPIPAPTPPPMVQFVKACPYDQFTPGDQALWDYFAGEGWQIKVYCDLWWEGDERPDLVVITESVDAAVLGDRYRDYDVPVIVFDPDAWAEMGLTTTGGTTTSGHRIDIIDATHPIADGPGATLDGTVELTASAQPLGTAGTNTIGPDAQIVATLDATPTSATIAAYDAGDTLADTTTASGIRVLAGLSQEALADLTTDGDALLHNLIAWTLDESLAFGDGRRPPIAVIIGGDDGPNPDGWWDGDLALQARLDAAGWTTWMHQDHFGSKGGYFNLIIISESADPALVHPLFGKNTAPMIVMDPDVWDDMGLAATAGTITTADTLDVLDAAHPVADGPAAALAGTLEVTTTPTGWNHIHRDDLTDTATPVITTTGNPDQVVAATIQVGTALVDDTTAAGPRVLLGMTDQAVPNLDADGWALFDNTVDWARHAYHTQTPGPTADTDLFVYDPDGRLTSDGNNTYTYDAAGRLTARTLAGDTPIEVGYGYTGDGVLVDLSVNDGATTDTYDLTWDPTAGTPQIAEHQHNTSTHTLVHGRGPIGTTDGWFARDHLGSVTGGPLAVAGTFDPWGHADHSFDQPAIGYGYRGELIIANEVHLRARNHNPLRGRFTTTDPLDGVGGTTVVANSYHYANNDPLNQVDPLGLRPSDLDAEFDFQLVVLDEELNLQGFGAARALSPYHDAVARWIRDRAPGHRLLDWDCAIAGAGRRGGWGRPDVCDTLSGELWEVKPASDYGFRTGSAQLGRYVSSARSGGQHAVRGRSYPPHLHRTGVPAPTISFSGSDATRDEGVRYYLPFGVTVPARHEPRIEVRVSEADLRVLQSEIRAFLGSQLSGGWSPSPTQILVGVGVVVVGGACITATAGVCAATAVGGSVIAGGT